MPSLFTPIELGPVRLSNRIIVSPMCQYSAEDGSAGDWHLQHLMALAYSGAALVIVEATAVERRGRISHGCLGLYSDANERALARVLTAAKAVALPGTKFGIQLSHAGRKASAARPWEGGHALSPEEDPWPTEAASPIPFNDGWPAPDELAPENIERIVESFAEAGGRAARLGFDVIELHFAHGYLGHNFYSPVSNRRDDEWGGDREGRMAFSFAVARAVLAAVPDTMAVGARITGKDWVEGGLEVEDAAALAQALEAAGLAYVCVSSGGVAGRVQVPVGPGYQVPLAEYVKAHVGIPVCAVGMIADPVQAEAILAEGRADLVALARAILDDPRWPWHAAERFGVDLPRPPQYARAAPKVWPGAKLARGTPVGAEN